MSSTLRLLLLFLPAWPALHAGAQTPPALPSPETGTAQAAEPRVERITHEDDLSRIDELRVGGQTRSITVQPKNGAPAYEVAPARGGDAPGESPGQRTGNSGKTSWPVLSF